MGRRREIHASFSRYSTFSATARLMNWLSDTPSRAADCLASLPRVAVMRSANLAGIAWFFFAGTFSSISKPFQKLCRGECGNTELACRLFQMPEIVSDNRICCCVDGQFRSEERRV